MSRTSRVLAWSVLSGALASSAWAQSTSVARLVPDLMLTAAKIQPGTLPADQSNIFVAGVQQLSTPAQFDAALALGLGSAPFGPTASGLLPWSGDTSATPTRAFGSSFGGQAMAIGHGRLGMSVTYETTDYATYDGIDMVGNGINFFIPQVTSSLADPNTRDLLQETVALKLNRKVVSFVLDYGLTSRFDVGVIVPIVQVAADARVTSQILRTATSATPTVHEFDQIDLGNKTFYGSATARGLGDLVVRARYAVLTIGRSSVAATLDAQLPTGSSENFVGLGATEVTPAVVYSGDIGRVHSHASVGYTWASGLLTSDVAITGSTAPAPSLAVPSEIDFSAGAAVPLAPRIGLVVEVTGRQQSQVPQFTSGTTVFPSRGPGALSTAASFTASDNFLSDGVHRVTSILTAIGPRINVSRRVAINGSVVFSGETAGLKPTMALAFWLDYGF